jgi:carbon starvation protein
MMVLLVFMVCVVLLGLGYRYYGRFLTKQLMLDDSRPTPAVSHADGVDFVPAAKPILLGHHFSSIAGAGPIVGPIVAAKAFGWAPALVWIVVGSIFVGGVHDLSALVASIRHKARSIAEIARLRMSPLAHRLFLLFIWFSLVYVLAVFMDLTATTFVVSLPLPGGGDVGGGSVASASVLYIGLAVVLGLALYRFKIRTLTATFVFVPLVFAAIAVGQYLPIDPSLVPSLLPAGPSATWILVLALYCLVASVLPVWLLLQPRDYLSSFLLYACVLGGLFGLAAGGARFTLRFDAYLGFEDAALGLLFPALFINIACGACSGFHSIVASGTTAKQLARESDAVPIAYGAMIIEGVLACIAVMALVTAMPDDPALQSPTLAFAAGIGRFLSALGLPAGVGATFGLLAISTFLLTTLDTATRLARYVFEEFVDGLVRFPAQALRLLATLVTVAVPVAFALTPLKDAHGQLVPSWKAIWPVFGATNQLLAALALIVVTVWLSHIGRPRWFTGIPGVVVLAITLVALVQLVWRHGFDLIGTVSAGLLLFALVLVFEAARVLLRAGGGGPEEPAEPAPPGSRSQPAVDVC